MCKVKTRLAKIKVNSMSMSMINKYGGIHI